jgi:hypothetical protein
MEKPFSDVKTYYLSPEELEAIRKESEEIKRRVLIDMNGNEIKKTNFSFGNKKI